MGKMWKWTGCAVAVLLVAGCGGRIQQLPGAAGERNVAIDLLIDYDSDHDQLLSSDEFDGALRAHFVELDRNSDGVLDSIEAAVENERRWVRAGSASTPLIDWNSDGSISFAEYSGALRSTFQELDDDDDGNLNAAELAQVEPLVPRAGPRPGADGGPPSAMVLDND
jgi:hypothetical protein